MKNYIVVGLGRFGTSVAKNLIALGHEVLVIDSSKERVNAVADMVTQGVIGNITDANVVKALGVRNFDAAVIAIGDNVETSVLATVLLKENGIPYVISKAQNELHGVVLQKVGADSIVYPEVEMGERVARRLSNNSILDMIEIAKNCSIVEIEVPKSWVGKSIRDLNVRAKYGINIIAVKTETEVCVSVLPDTEIKENDIIIVIGDDTKISKIN